MGSAPRRLPPFMVLLLLVLLLAHAASATLSWTAVVGGQYFAYDASPTDRTPLNGLGAFSDSVLSPMGAGVFTSGTVRRLVRNGTSVLFGGSFQWPRCDPRSCHRNFDTRAMLRNCAAFDFTANAWTAIGQGCAGDVYDLAVVGRNLFMVGSLTECFNAPGVGSPQVLVNNIVRWNDSHGWEDLGGEPFFGAHLVRAVACDTVTNRVYVVGATEENGSPIVYLQVLHQHTWNVLMKLQVTTAGYAFNTVRIVGRHVYVGGLFAQFNVARETQNIVRFPVDNVYDIDTMQGGVSGPVNDIVGYGDGLLLVGGNFATAGFPSPVVVNDLALYDTNIGQWASLGFHASFEPDWSVSSIDTLPDGAVAVAGRFFNVSTNASVTAVNNIALMQNGQWTSFGQVGSEVALAPYTMYAVVFVGTHEVVSFGYSTFFTENIIASYLETHAGGWAFLNQALLETGMVSGVAWSPLYGLALGGSFSSNGRELARGIALWNQTSGRVQQLGSGLFGSVHSMAFRGDWLYLIGKMNPTLFSAVGQQTSQAAYHFARFDFLAGVFEFPLLPPHATPYQSFHPLTSIHVIGDLIFVGGEFTFAIGSGRSTNVVAFSHPDLSWHAVGDPSDVWSPNSEVRSFASNATHLFVAGSFQLQVGTAAPFFNLACLDILANRWVELPRTCDRSPPECLAEVITSVALSGAPDGVFIAGNFTYVGSGLRNRVYNVAQLVDGNWVAMGSGLPTPSNTPSVMILSLAAVNATVANTTVIAAGNGMLQLFSGGDWAPVDAAWSFRVFDIRCVTIYYFEPILAWPVYGFVLLAIMCFTVLVGAIVVIAMMTKQRQRTHDYALLDTNVGVGSDGTSSDWLIDYDSLTIFNPPIGKGAYSVVNRAVLKGTVVAVKTFMGNDYYGDLKADFHREIALLTRLRHPNIILFIGACRSPLCIVTELAERGCLYDVIHQTPEEMTWVRVRSIALDSCRGLTYLHNQVPPILHRDLKSANVLIGENFVAKISDFGIAKRLQINTMTQRVGTTRWTAPEVLTNKADPTGVAYSLGSDVYSFGVILWEMITLELPWGDIAFDFQIEDHVIAGEHLPVLDGTPMEYVDVMLQCWQFDASDRPEFMTLINQIEAIPFLEGSPERRPNVRRMRQ